MSKTDVENLEKFGLASFSQDSSLQSLVIISITILACASTTSAQLTMELVYPNGSSTGTNTTCPDFFTCMNNLNTSMVCDQEGIYNASYTIGGLSSTFPAYPVCYSFKGYCKGAGATPYACFPNRIVEWSDTSNLCCGARPPTQCGKNLGTTTCANPGGSPDVWSIVNPTTTIGEVVRVACADGTLLSNGNTFLACADTTKLASSYPLLAVAQIGKPGRTLPNHGFICAEEDPTRNNSILAIHECTGGEPGYGAGASGSSTGERITLGELFSASIGRDDTLSVSAQRNINPAQGRISAIIITRWPGSEDLTRTLISARESDTKHLDIIKSKNTLTCSTTNGATTHSALVNISTWAPNEPHIIEMIYGPAGINCTVDMGASSKTQTYTPINPLTLTIGSAHGQAQKFNADINISINNLLTSDTHYCANDAQWVIDLDTKNQETCTRAHLAWTGSKCCSEHEDLPYESYNDPDPEDYDPSASGACYQSQHTQNGKILHNGSVALRLGQFVGCDLETHNQSLLRINDTHTNTTLIADKPACTTLFNLSKGIVNPVVCGLDGKWNFTNNLVQHHLAPTPQEILNALDPSNTQRRSPSGCCPQLSCWDGKRCIANQKDDSKTPSIAGYRCIDGNWRIQAQRTTFDRSDTGFCPRDDQCLIKSNGNPSLNDQPLRHNLTDPTKGPACIADGQHVLQKGVLGDFSGTYCQNGTWTTRTKTLALHLMDHAETTSAGTWAMFCDTYENALTFVSDIPGVSDVSGLLRECTTEGQQTPCVNEFCVLKYNRGVAWGVSLNKPINDPTKSFLIALGLASTSCNQHILPIADNQFHDCSQGVWYNQGQNSIIYLPITDQLPPRPTPTIIASQDPTLTTRLTPITTLAQSALTQELANITAHTTLLEHLYINRITSRDMIAFIETQASRGAESTYLGATYAHVNFTDISGLSGCTLINSKITTDLATACTNISNTLTFIGFQTPGGGNLDSIWPDVSAKLR
ncbi:hypothetical protein HY641_04920 [Candidatus Woesearchaeota archaeon]|nr:hypothetical protein [Candidatus Woesearchaeota archaeon]